MSIELSLVITKVLELFVIPTILPPMTHFVGQQIRGGKESIEKRKLDKTRLEPILKKAQEDVAEVIEPLGEAKIDQICLFLTSPESENIIRQIYSASILKQKDENLDTIRQTFLKAFSLYTNIPEAELQKESSQIFDILVQGCEEALKVAIDEGRLSAHEAKSNLRHRMLLNELEAVKKNLEFLTQSQQINVTEILKFEQDYRKQIAQRHDKIKPPFIGAAKRIAIEKIYITPNFRSYSERQSQKDSSSDDLFNSFYRIVVLGNPGGGKSTFAQKLCYDLATSYEDKRLADRKVTPIIVILRDYGVKKKNHHYSILKFIQTVAESTYQIKPPQNAFEYLLLNSRVMVIFDGLDELTDTSYRQEISADIESFCNLYPSVPVLVTSREVGYKEAPLDDKMFEAFRLAEFEYEQVEEYTQKWFALDEELTEEEKKNKIEAFLRESRNVNDLRSNPLILGLMCNIYRGEGYIPQNRPAVYEKCTELLFERWDKQRDIKLPELVKKIEYNLRSLIQLLAYYIYSNDSLQTGVTEEKLIAKASEYLLQKKFEEPDEARQVAQEFVQFCRGRAWVFSDVGTTPDGENLYLFTHRTFLEYFTAKYLVSKYITPNDLLEILLPKIENQEWDMICQLAFQIQCKNLEDAADELLTQLIILSDTKALEEQLNIHLFAVKCLKFIVPSPKVTRLITQSSLEKNLSSELEFIYDDNWGYYFDNYIDDFMGNTDLVNILDQLLYSHDENCQVINDSLKAFLENRINHSNNGLEKIILFKLLIYLAFVYGEWGKIYQELNMKYQEQFEKIYEDNLDICLVILNKSIDFLPIQCLIEWHGLDSIFVSVAFDSIGEVFNSCAFSIICHIIYTFQLFDDLDEINDDWDERKNIISDIKIISDYINQSIINNNLSFKRRTSGEDYDYELTLIFDFLNDTEMQSNLLLENALLREIIDESKLNIFLCTWFIFGFVLEYRSLGKEYLQELQTTENYILKDLKYTLISRFQPEHYDKVQVELDNCQFTPEQQAFIWRWVKREVNLIEDND